MPKTPMTNASKWSSVLILSALEARKNNKLSSLNKVPQNVARSRGVVLQWIPTHCGMMSKTKEGAQGDQPVNSVSFCEKRSIIGATMEPQTEDEYHQRTVRCPGEAPQWSQPAERSHEPQVQAGTITNLLVWPRGPGNESYPTTLSSSASDATECVAGCYATDNQTPWLQARNWRRRRHRSPELG